MRKLIVIIMAVALITASCGANPSDSNSAEQEEREVQTDGYELLVGNAPAHSMDGHSPTRNTINAWVDTWKVPGQLAFTYILNNAGEATGYYVFVGPPVSYCASLTPTWDWEVVDLGDSNGHHIIPAPGIDGVYYSGGQCIQYFGVDATTGALLEFTVGGALNYQTSTQPLPNYIDVPASGITTYDDVTPNADGEYVVPIG